MFESRRLKNVVIFSKKLFLSFQVLGNDTVTERSLPLNFRACLSELVTHINGIIICKVTETSQILKVFPRHCFIHNG